MKSKQLHFPFPWTYSAHFIGVIFSEYKISFRITVITIWKPISATKFKKAIARYKFEIARKKVRIMG